MWAIGMVSRYRTLKFDCLYKLDEKKGKIFIYIYHYCFLKILPWCFISVRNALVVFALFSMLGGVVVFGTSVMLITALRKEYEKKMVPWLYSFAAFTVFRFLAFIFFSIVNDMIFAYNITMCILWMTFICFSIYGWLIVYSLYVELCDLTRLEDLAHLRVSFFI